MVGGRSPAASERLGSPCRRGPAARCSSRSIDGSGRSPGCLPNLAETIEPPTASPTGRAQPRPSASWASRPATWSPGCAPRSGRRPTLAAMGRELPIFEPPSAAGAHHAGTAGLSIALGGGFGGAVRSAQRGHPRPIRMADRPAPPPRLDQGPDPVRRELPRAQGAPARADPQHGLRGGPLPEHRRVLGPAHGDDHDPGRHLHPGLRLLRGQDRPADLVRRRRAAARRRGARAARPRARRDHQRRPRRPARRRRPHLRRDDPPAPRGVARAWASRS